MNKTLKKVLIFVVALVFLFVLAILIKGFVDTGSLTFSPSYLTDPGTYTYFGVGVLLLLLKFLYDAVDGKGGKKKGIQADKGKDDSGKEMRQYYDSDWITEKQLKSDPAYNYCTSVSIRGMKNDGILVRAEKRNNSIEVNYVEPIHTLVIGTTSSGKTTQFLEPTIQLMCMTKAKPSFVISDPKGELYDHHAMKLQKEGYEIRVLDLRNPFSSTKWNPMSNAYEMYHNSFNMERLVKKHFAGDDVKNYDLRKEYDFNPSVGEWYEFDGNAYTNKIALDRDIEVRRGELRDKAYNELGEIAMTLAPVEDSKNPSWEKVAQSFIHGVMVAMLEDSMDPRLNMTKEKYNLYNVAKIVNYSDAGRDPYATLKKYFQGRDQFSKAPSLINTALNNAEGTTKNYMGFASEKLKLFNDNGICFMTSATEMDFGGIDERPTAFFLKIPDELQIRHPLATLFVSQLYKRLVDVANKTSKRRLKRNVYFLLDEFGNLPKFPEFGSSLAVGRSRGIFYQLVIQSYSQLNKKYGEEEAKIIRDNCPNQVYIGTDDMVTNKEFSELLGNRTVELTNTNVSTGPDGKENKSVSKSAVSRPLVYPHELTSFMKDHQLIVKTFKRGCIKSIFTPYYKALNIYDVRPAPVVYVPLRPFAENELYYDIAKRNDALSGGSGRKGPGSDDFSFFD